jgi:histidinol-phosphate/aromatic aminotransferase/cobyric acid decarboxylase-like protein
MNALLNDGDEVLVPAPDYPLWTAAVSLSSGTPVHYLCDEAKDWAPDLNDLRKKITARTKAIVVINPNNPTGDYITSDKIRYFLNSLIHLDLIIIDESFIHFAYEDHNLRLSKNEPLIHEFPNLIIVKSMSKDFGIAGIRAGYGVMNKERVTQLVSNGYLWNVSGLCDYFFNTYSDVEFQKIYDEERKRYINDTIYFAEKLSKISGIKVYSTKANFVLVQIFFY